MMITLLGSASAIQLFSTGDFCARVMDDAFRLELSIMITLLGSVSAIRLFSTGDFCARVMDPMMSSACSSTR
jgi:hypothetical protein